jgi:hypothetical protein
MVSVFYALASYCHIVYRIPYATLLYLLLLL